MTYQERPGTDQVFTAQADYIATVPDDRMRTRIVEALNGYGEQENIEALEAENRDCQQTLGKILLHLHTVQNKVKRLEAAIQRSDLDDDMLLAINNFLVSFNALQDNL